MDVDNVDRNVMMATLNEQQNSFKQLTDLKAFLKPYMTVDRRYTQDHVLPDAYAGRASYTW